METNEIVVILIIGIVILGVVLYANERFLGGGLVENVSSNLTQPIVITILNEKLPESGILGPVEVRKFEQQNDYLYEIKATPKLKIVGTHKTDLDVISVIRFKKHSIRATVGSDDKFAIKPEDEMAEPILSARLRSDIEPIKPYDGFYNNDNFNSNLPILIRSGRSAVLVGVSVSEFFSVDSLKNEFNPYDCGAVFSLEGPCITKFSNRLNGTPQGTKSERTEKINICGGEATITINDKPDCSKGTASVNIEYKDGKEWEDAGEKVYVSFWKDTTCTRQTSDFHQLLVLCPKDRLGGEFRLNAGCLIDSPPYDVSCFSNSA